MSGIAMSGIATITVSGIAMSGIAMSGIAMSGIASDRNDRDRLSGFLGAATLCRMEMVRGDYMLGAEARTPAVEHGATAGWHASEVACLPVAPTPTPLPTQARCGWLGLTCTSSGEVTAPNMSFEATAITCSHGAV